MTITRPERVRFDRESIEDARENGNVIAGGAAMDRPGYFSEPTIVRDIQEGSKLVDEEQSGPALPVIKYSDKDDVIRRANARTYGRRLRRQNPPQSRLVAQTTEWHHV